MKSFVQLGSFLLMTALCVAAEAPGFSVTKKYIVPGDGSFDYIIFDSSSSRLYVSHGPKMDVLDADSGKIVGKIEDTPGVHGIALVPKLHRGFTSNGKDSTVSVIDTETFKTIRKISVPEDPDMIIYDPQANRVLLCHGDAAVITVIDPEKEAVIGKINLGGPAEAAVLDGKGTGFVNLVDAAMVLTFDPQTLTVKQKWPTAGCRNPVGLAIDIPNSRLFIGCRSKVLAVMDANTGHVIETLPIGDGVDAVVFDSDNRLIFASNRDGTVSVIRQKSVNEYESVGDILTQKSAKTMAFDPRSKRLFLPAAEMLPPPPGNAQPSHSTPKPGTFGVLVIERQ